MKRKILIMGLPGAGKTTLAGALAPLLNAVVFNADAVRANLSRDLGFTLEDRVDFAFKNNCVVDCLGRMHARMLVRSNIAMGVREVLRERRVKHLAKLQGIRRFGRPLDDSNDCSAGRRFDT